MRTTKATISCGSTAWFMVVFSSSMAHEIDSPHMRSEISVNVENLLVKGHLGIPIRNVFKLQTNQVTHNTLFHTPSHIEPDSISPTRFISGLSPISAILLPSACVPEK